MNEWTSVLKSTSLSFTLLRCILSRSPRPAILPPKIIIHRSRTNTHACTRVIIISAVYFVWWGSFIKQQHYVNPRINVKLAHPVLLTLCDINPLNLTNDLQQLSLYAYTYWELISLSIKKRPNKTERQEECRRIFILDLCVWGNKRPWNLSTGTTSAFSYCLTIPRPS